MVTLSLRGQLVLYVTHWDCSTMMTDKRVHIYDGCWVNDYTLNIIPVK